jgi:type IV secretory pathway TrbD component
MIMYVLNTIFALFGLVVYSVAAILFYMAVRKAARLLRK